ncbi:MAG: bifunctional hydroxymethylpyrimidine kinase/phosphomethylpyrimidine kinase [Clostridia bacterium]|nr:bifunctional hydroxymethylpyrimidine kinase/phosphomethylpyrimidine kinase [Clostridia bacterium]
MKKLKTVLTIAGSDSSAGAGIQADLKTMLANGVYGMSVITALTAQNTTGVSDIYEIPADFVKKQINCIFNDIVPDAVKIGMVSSREVIEAICDQFSFYHPKNVVIDPVMVSTSGTRLLTESAYEGLGQLFSYALLLTPNIPEAQLLAEYAIAGKKDMETAAKMISTKYHCAVLLKGGHDVVNADDVLYTGQRFEWICGERIDNKNTHGTGCTLSSAVAAYLAKGFDLLKAVRYAKQYLEGAIRSGLDLGMGTGPLDHGYYMNQIKERNRL